MIREKVFFDRDISIKNQEIGDIPYKLEGNNWVHVKSVGRPVKLKLRSYTEFMNFVMLNKKNIGT